VAGRLAGADSTVLRRLALRYDEAVVALLGGQQEGNELSGIAGGGLTVIASGRAAEFCARWGELTRR
jgi:hypothetical protein